MWHAINLLNIWSTDYQMSLKCCTQNMVLNNFTHISPVFHAFCTHTFFSKIFIRLDIYMMFYNICFCLDIRFYNQRIYHIGGKNVQKSFAEKDKCSYNKVASCKIPSGKNFHTKILETWKSTKRDKSTFKKLCFNCCSSWKL